MSALRTRVLLREYVRTALAEDFGGDLGGFGDMGGMGGGMGGYGEIVGGDQLYDIFVQPFVNAIGHAAGKTKELSQKGITLLKVAFETVATSLIPFLKDDYANIFAHEKKELDKIRSEYGKYYQATWDAFKNEDIMIAAFMYRPDLFVTVDLAQKAPKVAAKLLSVLSGGALDKVLSGIIHGKKDDEGGGAEDFWSQVSKHAGKKHEGILREDDDGNNVIAKLVANKKVKQVLANSEATQKSAKLGQEMVRNTLKQVFDQAHGVLSAKSLEDLQKKVGKKLPGLDKLAKVPDQERQKAEQELLIATKKMMKEFYVKQLEGQVKKALDAGVPHDHPFIHDYNSVIAKIKAV